MAYNRDFDRDRDEAQEERWSPGNRYERHDLAMRFGPPPVDERSPAFKEMVADIKANGLHHPLILYEGKVLCGWTRYRAGLEANIELRFVTCQGTAMDAVKRIISEDGLRRHMNYTQRVYAAARMVTSTHGGDRRSAHKSGKAQVDKCPLDRWAGYQVANLRLEITQAMAADGWDVSQRSVWNAIKTLREASDSPVAKEIETALRLGKTTFGQVTALIEKPAEEQQGIVRSDEWKFGRLRERLAKERQPKRAVPPQNRLGKVFERIDGRQARRDFIRHVVWDRLDEEDRIWVKTMLGGEDWFRRYEGKYGA
jgi:hypothetical protein